MSRGTAELPRTQAGASALDLHEEICDPGASPSGCDRWPERLRLRSTLGQLVKGRCHAVNLCDYCARLAAVENSELLALDALHGVAPSVWCVLTTPRASIAPRDFYRSRAQLHRAWRRRWPELETASLVEFTTGYGTRAGGKRRPHWNVLLKGVDRADVGQVHDVISEVWCPRVGGNADAQHVGTVGEFGGLMRYIALHFQKESQAPPAGWTGHRFLKTRGYLWTGTNEAREAARAALRLKRELWRALEAGHDPMAAEAIAQAAVDEASELAWELVRLQPIPTAFDEDGQPVAWETVELEVRT